MSYSFNSSKHFPNLLLTERSLNILGSNLDKLGLPRPGYGFFQALRLFQTNENKTTSISYLSNDVVVFFFFELHAYHEFYWGSEFSSYKSKL